MPSEEEEAREVGMICAVCDRPTYNIREAWLCNQCEAVGKKSTLENLKGMESVAKGDFIETIAIYDLEFDEAFGSLEMYPDAHNDSSVNYSYGYLMAIQAVISVVKTESK